MTRKHDDRQTIGPLAAIATVPGDFLSGAIAETVIGACRAVGAFGRAIAGLRRRR